MVSNSDNLGATVDPKILGYMVDRELDFLMEATPKTRLDVKGGGPVRIDGQLTLLEQGQIPSEHVPEFQNIERYTVFNTNTLWINVAAIKANLEKLITQLPLIVNPKTFDGHKTIQLETAMGAALGVFDRAGLVVVSRDRFIPVKQTSDLMLIRSDAVDVYDDCFFRYAPEFKAHDFAKISLGDAFKTVDHFEQRVKVIPSLKAVTSLRIDGDVTIATAQSFAGDQVITAEPGNSLTL